MLYSQNSQYGTTNLATLQTRKWASTCLMLIAVTALFMMPDMAHAAGLSKATSGMQKFLDEIQPIVRIIAIISIIGAGAGYMANMLINQCLSKSLLASSSLLQLQRLLTSFGHNLCLIYIRVQHAQQRCLVYLRMPFYGRL